MCRDRQRSCRSRCAAVAAAQRALPFDEVEAFGRGGTALGRGASLNARAAVATQAALERNLSPLTSPLANQAAPEIAPTVPAASPGPLPSRGRLARSFVWHVTPRRCISGAISWARAGRWRGTYRVGATRYGTPTPRPGQMGAGGTARHYDERDRYRAGGRFPLFKPPAHLEKGETAVGGDPRACARGQCALHVRIALDRDLPSWEPAPRERHQGRFRAAHEEAVFEREPHV